MVKKAKKLTIDVINLKGKIIKNLDLPEAVFSVKLIPSLLAQAIRVFSFNQSRNQRQVKTRAEVKMSTRKIYAQKGTGRARHGSRRAPIFVGGGKAHGPRGWLKRLMLPKKMKLKVLAMVLSKLYQDKNLLVIDSWPKTSQTQKIDQYLTTLAGQDKQSLLLVYKFDKNKNIWQAGRNLIYARIKPVGEVSFFDFLKAKKVIIDEKSLLELIKRGRVKNEA